MANNIRELDFVDTILTNSWKDPSFKDFFYNLVRKEKPYLCVELGTFGGYSAFCTALALRDNGLGELDCYDLWDLYSYNKQPKDVAEKNLADLPVHLFQENAYKAHDNYADDTVDYLLVDLSNDGDTYEIILKNWLPKLTDNATVVMEGGSEMRDSIMWMEKFRKKPIFKTLQENTWIKDNYDFVIMPDPFPSITVFRKYPAKEIA